MTKIDYLIPYSAGIDFRRQILTSIYRRQILTLEVDPRADRINNIYNGRGP